MHSANAPQLGDTPRLIEVDGRMLCTQIRGRGPTVVLDGGGTGQGVGGGWGREFEDGLASMATVVTYDRSGVGHSDGRQARTIAQMADDLHELVHATGVVLPAVFVGWSYGGLVTAMHALRHPGDVAGLVFVDPTPAAPVPMPAALRLPLQFLGVTQLRAMASASAAGLFGTAFGQRLIHRSVTRTSGTEPSREMLELATSFYTTPRAIRELARMLARMDTHLREVHQAMTARGACFPDVPTTVLAAAIRPERIPAKHRRHLDAGHRQLAELAPNGRVVLAEDATHQLPLEQPQLVLRHIAETIASPEHE